MHTYRIKGHGIVVLDSNGNETFSSITPSRIDGVLHPIDGVEFSKCTVKNFKVVVDEAKVLKFEALEKEKQDNAYKKLRSDEYEKEGLSFNSFIELLIENDVAAMEKFRAKRGAIKVKHPKPVEA